MLISNRTARFVPMAFRRSTHYTPHGLKSMLVLQDRGIPIRPRNISIRELKGYDKP